MKPQCKGIVLSPNWHCKGTVFCKLHFFFERRGKGRCPIEQVKAIRVVARFCICCFSLACAARIFFCSEKRSISRCAPGAVTFLKPQSI